jgi:hypothetical protein
VTVTPARAFRAPGRFGGDGEDRSCSEGVVVGSSGSWHSVQGLEVRVDGHRDFETTKTYSPTRRKILTAGPRSADLGGGIGGAVGHDGAGSDREAGVGGEASDAAEGASGLAVGTGIGRVQRRPRAAVPHF